jgi:hypothetical protein
MVASWECVDKKLMCATEKGLLQDAITDVHTTIITALFEISQKYKNSADEVNGGTNYDKPNA